GIVHFTRQRFDALGQRLYRFRELSVLLKHFYKKPRLLCRKRRPFLARLVQGFTMFRIGESMGCIAVGLPGLREQDEGSRIGGLQAESEVQENERVYVECCEPDYINQDPNGDDSGLSDKETRGSKETSEGFSFQGKPVVAKDRM